MVKLFFCFLFFEFSCWYSSAKFIQVHSSKFVLQHTLGVVVGFVTYIQGIWWERDGDLFEEGGCSFCINSKLKSEFFNDKKDETGKF